MANQNLAGMATESATIDLKETASLGEGRNILVDVVAEWAAAAQLRAFYILLKRKENNKSASITITAGDSVIGSELIGDSEAMRDIFYKVEKIAPTDANILILGENGTGKDLIAKAIHQKLV